MLFRIALSVLLSLSTLGCTGSKQRGTCSTATGGEGAILRGLQEVHQVRLQVTIPANEADAVQQALQARAKDQIREHLPQLSTDGMPEDWLLEFSIVWHYENLPLGAAKVRDRWAVCHVRLVKPTMVDGRNTAAVAYTGPVLWPERVSKTPWSNETPWPSDLSMPSIERYQLSLQIGILQTPGSHSGRDIALIGSPWPLHWRYPPG